jgi:hypothetical protein
VAIEVDVAILESYTGAYDWVHGGEDGLIRVKLEGEQLLITDGEEWTPLYAETETTFFLQGEEMRFVFTEDDSGAVSGLSILTQGVTLPVAVKID